MIGVVISVIGVIIRRGDWRDDGVMLGCNDWNGDRRGDRRGNVRDWRGDLAR